MEESTLCLESKMAPVCPGLLLRETEAKLPRGSNWQKWLVGRALCTNSNTTTFHLFLHLLVIQGFQEAYSTLGLSELRGASAELNCPL